MTVNRFSQASRIRNSINERMGINALIAPQVAQISRVAVCLRLPDDQPTMRSREGQKASVRVRSSQSTYRRNASSAMSTWGWDETALASVHTISDVVVHAPSNRSRMKYGCP